jgi:hypothetical protein
MVTFPELVALLLIAGGGWLLWDSLKAREAANTAIRTACKAQGHLFLDDTVHLESLWPARNAEGRLALRRRYAFDYSDTGDNRRKGTVVLVGTSVTAVDIRTPEDFGQTT